MSRDMQITEFFIPISELLGNFSTTSKNFKGQDENGIVFAPSEDRKLLMVRFATSDDIDIQVAFNVGDMLRNPNDYLSGMMEDIIQGINKKRKDRSLAGPTIITSPDGEHIGKVSDVAIAVSKTLH